MVVTRKSKWRWPLHITFLLLLFAWPLAVIATMLLQGTFDRLLGPLSVIAVYLTLFYPVVVFVSIAICGVMQQRRKSPILVSVVAALPLLTPVPYLAVTVVPDLVRYAISRISGTKVP